MLDILNFSRYSKFSHLQRNAVGRHANLSLYYKICFNILKLQIFSETRKGVEVNHITHFDSSEDNDVGDDEDDNDDGGGGGCDIGGNDDDCGEDHIPGPEGGRGRWPQLKRRRSAPNQYKQCPHGTVLCSGNTMQKSCISSVFLCALWSKSDHMEHQ